ncbi:MAG: anthranilate synthase component I, partial [Dehalococcoidia bacterium]|nr:anthranilate synthase component I [Dehalococcoidia bacterium]
MYHPSLEEVKKLVRDGNLVPIYREIVADMETPVSAFLKVCRGRYSFLLESVEGGQRQARYSFIGTEPEKTIIVRAGDQTGPLQAVKAEMDRYKQVQVYGLPILCGGAVGYLSYEAS